MIKLVRNPRPSIGLSINNNDKCNNYVVKKVISNTYLLIKNNLAFTK